MHFYMHSLFTLDSQRWTWATADATSCILLSSANPSADFPLPADCSRAVAAMHGRISVREINHALLRVTSSFTYTKQMNTLFNTGLINLHSSMNIFPCLFTKVTSDLFVFFFFYQSVLTENNFHPVLMGLVQSSNTRALPALPREHNFTL